jgi:ABC-type Zn uptake system ZnuABC Zn-binding protein ZnuA
MPSDPMVEHGPGLDPHIWFDPTQVIHWVDRIMRTLVHADPDHALAYRTNASNYQTELGALDDWIQEQLGVIPSDRRKLVLDHLAMGYFAERYGFEIVSALLPAFSSAAETSARDLAVMSNTIREQAIPAIFVGMDSNPRLAQQLALDLGIEVVQLYTGSLSSLTGPAATYQAMMMYNVLAIQQALSPGG